MNKARSCIAPLFVPGNRPERFAKASASGADAVVVDLEDAVAPADKAAARDTLIGAGPLGDVPTFVRINGRGTPWFEDDLAAIGAHPWAGVVLPKAEQVQDVQAISAAVPVIALIETARGLANARAIAAAEGVVRMAFGSVDFAADMGLAHNREALLTARSELVLASRLAGLNPPLDGVTLATDDAAVIESDARYAAALGFSGKLCIHPAQIKPVLAGFAPSEEELAWAKTILAAGPEGAVAVEGTLVDKPVRRRAEAILARAALSASL